MDIVSPPPLPADRRAHLAAQVDEWQAGGRYTFTRADALAALGVGPDTFRQAVFRLVRKGRLAVPCRGFYVIVPLEYRVAGCPPASWFVDPLLAYLEHPYYVGLLSAAALFGAAHEQPQEFQVVTDAPRRPMQAGRVRLRFLVKRRLPETPTLVLPTMTGSMRVSTPEATAWDLIRYPHAAGALGNGLAVLAELAERLVPERLAAVVSQAGRERTVSQRLGYLLAQAGAPAAAEAILRALKPFAPRPVGLRPDRPTAGTPWDRRFGVRVNEELQPEGPT